MGRWKYAFKNRFQLTVILAAIGLIFLLIGIFFEGNNILVSIFSCIGTSLISASVTIFLVKFDILDMFRKNNIDKYGIMEVKSGRNQLFVGEEKSSLNCKSWEEFLKKSSDKTIDIIGISMYSFLWSNRLIDLMLKLAEDNYIIRIVFANPDSEEVKFQSIEERKPGKLAENILYTSNKIIELISQSQNGRLSANFSVYYSQTLPRAFIVRSGCRMIITPYLLRGPFYEPTIIADKWCAEEKSFYNAYMLYIDDLINSADKKV